MNKVVKRILIGIVLFIMLIAAVAVAMIVKTNKAVENQANVDIDMNEVADGVYEGSSDGGLVQVTVSVTVENHKITDIQILKHQNGKGTPAEVITDDMVAENTYDVDIVSGATISSKTIKNAVNVALQKGLTQ